MAKKILIVDYEPKSLEQTVKLLQNAGYDIIKAKDGLAAIEIFNNEKPDAVVLAAMLPKMHGFEVCRTIKKTEKGKQTPLLITTGVYKGEKYKRQALTEYGADGFFEKPYNPNEFLSYLNELLNQNIDNNSQARPIDLDTDLEAKLEDTLSGLMEVGSDSDVISTDTNLEAKLEDTLAGLMNVEEAETPKEKEADTYFNPLELSGEDEDIKADQKAQASIPSEEDIREAEEKYNISDIDERLEDTLSSMLNDEEEPEIRDDTDIDKRLQETLSGLDIRNLSGYEEKQESAPSPPDDATIEFDTLNAIREREEEAVDETPEGFDDFISEEKIEKAPEDEIIKEDTKTSIIEKYGQYELIEKIATGGMAELFKARRINVEGFEKIVAIKRILPHLAEDKEFITMFIDEAKLAAQLTHQNIVQIYDLDKVNSSFYIAMEYVKGKNARAVLHKLKKRGNRLPIELTLFIISKVCSALDYAHRRRDFQNRLLNIVHRDVSPQNVLLSYEGEVKLVDFGIAKAATKASQTQAGALKGKILYMSPEQAWGKKVDKRSDIYSIGIVLFEMLTGKRLFSGSSEIDILEKVRKSIVTKPSELNPKVTEELDRIVIKALAKDPKDRFQNASDMQHDIENLLFSPKLKARKYNLAHLMKFLFKDEMLAEGEELEGPVIDYFSEEVAKEAEKIEQVSKASVEPAVLPKKEPVQEDAGETIEIDTFKDLSSQSQPIIKTDKKEIKEAKQSIAEDWDGREAGIEAHKDLPPYEEADAVYSGPVQEYQEEEEFEIPTGLRKKKTPLPFIIGGIAAVVIIVLAFILFTGGDESKKPGDKDGQKSKFEIVTEELDGNGEAEILTPEEIRQRKEEQEKKERIASLIEKANESLNSDRISLASNYIDELKKEDPNNPSIQTLENTLAKRQGELAEQQDRDRQLAQQDELKRQEEQKQRQIADLLTRAEEALAGSNYQQAQELAKNILDMDSSHERASQIFGQAEIEMDRLDKEKQQEQQIVSLLSQANNHLSAKEYSNAKQSVNNILAIDPQNKRANDLLIDIEKAERAELAAEKERLKAERILDAEADVQPKMTSSLSIDLAHLERRVPHDFKMRFREVKEKLKNRIPVQLDISDTGKVENVRFSMRKVDLEILERFGFTAEIEKALKEAEFSPAIKDGIRRKCIHNMFLNIKW